MFKFIGDFLSGLWRFADRWRVPPFAADGARVGNRLGGALMFLVLLLGVIAIILVAVGAIFGFSVEQTLGGVDAWLDGIAPSADLIGKFLIQKVLMAIILFFCIVGGIVLLYARRADGRSWGSTILALLFCLAVGYCSAVNLVAPLDPYDPSVGSQYLD
jgi:hypothetical protein